VSKLIRQHESKNATWVVSEWQMGKNSMARSLLLKTKGKVVGSDKRKEREEEQQEGVVKRMRVDEEGTPNCEVKANNSTINEQLPHELLSAIITFAGGEPAPRVMWVVGRLVCKLWQNLFPSSEAFKQHLGLYRNRERRLCSQIAEQGWVSLLLWVNLFYAKGFTRIMDAAAKYGYLDLLKKLKEEDYLTWSFHMNRILVNVVKGGQLAVVKWLNEHESCFASTPQAAHTAIKKGRLKVAKFLHFKINVGNGKMVI